MKKQKGISLIVLIITIVVIIILATAIIVNLAQTNIINNAKEATVKQDIKALQDELTMYIADEYVNTLGEFKVEDLDVTDKDEIAKIMPSIKGTKYADYVVIEDGKIAITETMPEPNKTWAMEALGLVDTTNNTPTEPTEPEDTATPVVAINTIVTTANATITGEDFEYNNPVIPVGFKAIETTNATWTDSDNDGVPDGWNNGLVIQDENDNEFVWVPCTLDGANGSIQYTKNFTYPSYYGATESNTTDDTAVLPTVNETTIDETEQITKYGGFYIGRYEAGVPEGGSASNTTGTPVVKQGATVWTNITYANANTNAKSLYTTDYVKSGLITGTAWDTVCAWIQSEIDSDENVIYDVTNSASWGNYSDTTGDAQYDTDGTTKISGTKRTAGYSECWKAKNIYDIAGNTWEWTGEIYSSHCVNRGGCCDDDGSARPASYRSKHGPSDANVSISFRLALYVM